MSAEKTFEEINMYKQNVVYPDKVIMYSDIRTKLVITFYLEKKEIAIDSLKDGQGKRYELSYKVFQAINKQMEELGWNNE
ncbi:MAG: hypothetical protein IKE89_03495 [Bacilli bacterium]|nr:hypothetical protein [Bacilli bacterium]MBR2711516.1 hypothetical protein [Bacilli bacterium]